MNSPVKAESLAGWPTAKPILWSILVLAGVGSLILIPRLYVLGMFGAVIAWAVIVVTLGSVAYGKLDWLVLCWVVFFPLGYYFLSLPEEKPIFTLDRAFVALLVLGLVSIGRSRGFPIFDDIKRAGWWWAGFLVAAFLSLWDLSAREMVGPLHILVEDFLMPAVLGFFIMRYFDVRKNLVWLHAGCCIMAFYIGVMGLIELVTAQDLLPLGETGQFLETDNATLFRVDGPFANATSYALIGMVTFFFILYQRRYLPERLPAWQAILHWLGAVSALAAGLMTLHRGMVLALVAVCVVDYFSKVSFVPRRTWQILWLLVIGGVLVGKVFYPGVYNDRVSNPDNFYLRLAQHRQTFQVIADHPVVGVGINRFYEAVYMNPRYFVTYMGFDPMNYVHSNILSIAAETGILGLAGYLLAQFFFAKAMWKTRRINPLGWQTFLYILMIYTIFGLDVTSGYFSDLNLWYLLTLGVIAQLQARSVVDFLQTQSSEKA